MAAHRAGIRLLSLTVFVASGRRKENDDEEACIRVRSSLGRHAVCFLDWDKVSRHG